MVMELYTCVLFRFMYWFERVWFRIPAAGTAATGAYGGVKIGNMGTAATLQWKGPVEGSASIVKVGLGDR